MQSDPISALGSITAVACIDSVIVSIFMEDFVFFTKTREVSKGYRSGFDPSSFMIIAVNVASACI